MSEIDRICGRRLENGAYWYDRVNGSWGRQGSGPSGQIQPGLDLGGPLHADASGGTTGVFINGRQLGFWELMRLRRITSLPRGRYWLDANSNFGTEGGPARGNLRLLESQANRMFLAAVAVNALIGLAGAAAGTASGGRNGIPGGVLSTYDKCGCTVIGS